MVSEQFFLEHEKEQLFCLTQNQKEDNNWILCCHGLVQDKCESWFLFSKIAQAAVDIDFSVFRFDFRGHGDSTGDLINITTNDLYQDLVFVIEYIRKTYHPKNLILLGMGYACNLVCKVANEMNLDKVIMINPSAKPIFNYKEALTGEAKKELEENHYLAMNAAKIDYSCLEKIHYSGSIHWNICGVRIGFDLIQEMSKVQLRDIINDGSKLQWYAVISNEKKQEEEFFQNLLQTNQSGQLEIIKGDPLFTHPKLQTKVVAIVKGWLEANV